MNIFSKLCSISSGFIHNKKALPNTQPHKVLGVQPVSCCHIHNVINYLNIIIAIACMIYPILYFSGVNSKLEDANST